MCGLVGYLSNQNTPVVPDVLLSKMADFIAHRRLSVVDLSSAGYQPMHVDRGRYVMVFNGEIYSHSKLRIDLEVSNRSLNWNVLMFQAWLDEHGGLSE